MESPWERVFYDDINNMKAIIFIGYSLDYDFDLQKVMHEIIKGRAFLLTRRISQRSKNINLENGASYIKMETWD